MFGTVMIREAKNRLVNAAKGMNYMLHTEVVVGITEESDVVRENGITNSQLMYLQENGVPSHNIPPRPVIKPALAQDEVKNKMKSMIKDAWKAALIHGDTSSAEQCFHKAGMVGRDACKEYITSGDKLAPNSEKTIRRKGSSTPLIDTGSMLNSISYEVRKKGLF